jgi:protein-S-isoprenylcysteine O-methyltransferase Ste14
VGWFIAFPLLEDTYATRVFSDPTVNQVIDLAVLVALVCYMLSGTALAFSYSNLTYKKIQTQGPYRFIRHPATVCKLMFFTLSFFRFNEAYTWKWGICYACWIGIYIGRALVEERFLKSTPEYRAYMQRTRYRFFPGIV